MGKTACSYDRYCWGFSWCAGPRGADGTVYLKSMEANLYTIAFLSKTRTSPKPLSYYEIENRDYLYDDIGEYHPSTYDTCWSECAKICTEAPNCVAFSVLVYKFTCYLKSFRNTTYCAAFIDLPFSNTTASSGRWSGSLLGGGNGTTTFNATTTITTTLAAAARALPSPRASLEA